MCTAYIHMIRSCIARLERGVRYIVVINAFQATGSTFFSGMHASFAVSHSL